MVDVSVVTKSIFRFFFLCVLSFQIITNTAKAHLDSHHYNAFSRRYRRRLRILRRLRWPTHPTTYLQPVNRAPLERVHLL